MARSLEQILDGLPAKRRARITRRAADLATTLKQLRTGKGKTQAEMSDALGVGQDTISRIESREDMLVSTVRRYVEALGGELELVARFPGRPPVVIKRPEQSRRKGRAP